jgi:hypothetical protein
MGIASSLFFSSNDTEKQTLQRRITPSAEQMQEQQDRWNELAENVMADLRAETGCPIRSWLQGSYKYRTQIRPPRKGDEFDIDLGIFVCWSGQADSGPHTPDNLRNALHISLQAYAASTDVVRSLDEGHQRLHRDRRFRRRCRQRDRGCRLLVSGLRSLLSDAGYHQRNRHRERRQIHVARPRFGARRSCPSRRTAKCQR